MAFADKVGHPGAIEPMVCTWKLSKDDDGDAFYTACAVGEQQWINLSAWLKKQRAQLIKQKQKGAVTVIPDEDSEAVTHMKDWLLGSACQEELQSMSVTQKNQVCPTIQDFMNDLVERTGQEVAAIKEDTGRANAARHQFNKVPTVFYFWCLHVMCLGCK